MGRMRMQETQVKASRRPEARNVKGVIHRPDADLPYQAAVNLKLPGGQMHREKRSFATAKEAQAWRAEMRRDRQRKLRGLPLPPARYGSRFWAVREPTGEEDCWMWLYADTVTVDAVGSLLCGAVQRDGSVQVMAAFAPGAWVEVQAASVLDGRALCVDDTLAGRAPK